MFGLRKINPLKIEQARGERKRSEIVTVAREKFSEQDLYNWEKGKNLPRPDKLPHLLLGLGVTYEQITDEVSFEVSAT